MSSSPDASGDQALSRNRRLVVVTATYVLDEHEYELNVPVYACSEVVQFG